MPIISNSKASLVSRKRKGGKLDAAATAVNGIADKLASNLCCAAGGIELHHHVIETKAWRHVNVLRILAWIC